MEKQRPCNPLVEWALKREELRLVKASGAMPPWTDDRILHKYRFCNVRRRDDRVSQWLIKHVLSKHADYDPWVFLQFSALCRWINWPPTIQHIFDFDLVDSREIRFGAIGSMIDDLQAKTKAWTGAYIVNAAGSPPGWGKGRFVCERNIRRAMGDARKEIMSALDADRLYVVYDVLRKLPGWGTFMAGQVIADWTYTPVLGGATDLYYWAPIGPGSKRGYNRLMGLPVRHPPPRPAQWNEQLGVWRKELVVALNTKFNTSVYVHTVTLHDVQNCLCEYDKYRRVELGEGTPRSLYKQETSF